MNDFLNGMNSLTLFTILLLMTRRIINFMNKNIKGEILKLVAKRIKPNQSIALNNAACSTCIIKKDPRATATKKQKKLSPSRNASPPKSNNHSIKQKNLGLDYGTVFLTILPYHLSQCDEFHEAENRNNSNQFRGEMQMISQWVENMLQYLWSPSIKREEIAKIKLPFDENERMGSLRLNAYDKIDLTRIQWEEKTHKLPKRLVSSLIMDDMNKQESYSKRQNPFNPQNNSNQENNQCPDELQRLLYLQALAIEKFI